MTVKRDDLGTGKADGMTGYRQIILVSAMSGPLPRIPIRLTVPPAGARQDSPIPPPQQAEKQAETPAVVAVTITNRTPIVWLVSHMRITPYTIYQGDAFCIAGYDNAKTAAKDLMIDLWHPGTPQTTDRCNHTETYCVLAGHGAYFAYRLVARFTTGATLHVSAVPIPLFNYPPQPQDNPTPACSGGTAPIQGP